MVNDGEYISLLQAALAEARRLANQTVRDSYEVAANHKDIDSLLDGCEHDDPDERYDAPTRVANRKWMDGYFKTMRQR